MHRVLNPLPQRAFAAFAWSAVFALFGAGCSSWSTVDLPGVTPYRMEIQQGNFVSQEMVAKLKRGMSREQVRFVLGTPLVSDLFHANRWDYVFYRERPGQPREARRISIFFDNDKLARVEGDVVPKGAASKATSEGSADGGAKTDAGATQ